jgi:hypothetical protein
MGWEKQAASSALYPSLACNILSSTLKCPRINDPIKGIGKWGVKYANKKADLGKILACMKNGECMALILSKEGKRRCWVEW